MSRTQEKINDRTAIVYAGIDVGKDTLDFHAHPIALSMQVSNDPKGITKLTRLCLKHEIRMVALEAASKYHRQAHEMLYEAGIIKRRGNIESKNTVSDYHDIEHERASSVFATPLHTEWRNYKINIIDTPGLDDFIGEIISSIRVSDTITTVINAKYGVEIGTEIIWNYIDKYHKPTLFVINQIDHEQANFENSFNISRGVDPVFLPSITLTFVPFYSYRCN